MNRRFALTAHRFVVVSWLPVALLAGCQHRVPDYDLARAAVAAQTVKDIEPLTLKEVEPNDVTAGEPNEPPPEKLELSLEQCRAMALENNLEIKATLINPTIATERLNAEEAKFESSFYANLTYNKTDNPSVGFSDQITGTKSNFGNTNLGVQVPLRTGGTVTFDATDTRVKTDAIGTEFNPYFASDLSASISHPLLRNAGRWINTHSIRIVAYERQITDARTRLDVITVLAALDRVYWRLYAARRELEVRRQQYDLAQLQLEQVRRLVDVGEQAQVEVIRAEARVAAQLEAINNDENNLRDRERDLKRVMNSPGLDMQTPTVVAPITEPDPVRYELEPARLVATALDGRMELLEFQLRLLQDASTIGFQRNQTLPLASLGYTYNVTGLGASRDNSWDLLFNNDFVDHRLGLQVVVPLGNEAAKGRLRQAIYEHRQRLATEASRKASIELEVLNAMDQVEANWQRILAARQNSIVSARVHEAEKRQFEQGMRTSTEVLDAQTKFADAQSAEIRALAEYQIALVDLAYATGTLLGAARIHWEPIVPPTDVE